MGKKKTARPKPPKVWKVELKIGDNLLLTLDVGGFRKSLDLRLPVIEAEDVKVNEKTGCRMYSLTQCADIIGVDAPQLNYYVKDGRIRPIGKPEAGTKKYFSEEALLAFLIIVQLKERLGRTVNLMNEKGDDVLSGLQKLIEAAA